MFAASSDSGQGAFNYAWKYLERLDSIEKALGEAFAENDWEMQFRLLFVYYSELIEWMDVEEDKEHLHWVNDAEDAYDEIKQSRNRGKATISREVPRVFFKWLVALKRLKHAKGLTMPKKDDARFAMK
jgi:hypothetical protein